MKKIIAASVAVLTILTAAACSYHNHTNVNVSAGTNTPATLTVESSDGNKDTSIVISSDNPGVIDMDTYPAGTIPSQGQNSAVLPLSDDEALTAIQNYCFDENPSLKDTLAESDYPTSWIVESQDSDQVVVLYRSYTGAQIRYYIDRKSGDAYVTELVPGIIDEETENGVKINVRDYISD